MPLTMLVKSLRDRWLACALGAGALAIFLVLAMAAYREIDLSLYTGLPEAMRDLLGIPADADVASLTYNVVLGTLASLTVAGLAVALGAGAIAGEERAGTLGLLLANPRSRRQVLLAKAGAMVMLVGAMGLALWAAGRVAPAVLGVGIGETEVGATVLHLGANALVWGFLALAAGAWTGNSGTASGTAAGAMVLSFVAVGLLPLVDAVDWAVKFVPWYYFDGSQPLVNGVSWGHLAVQLAATALLAAVALAGFERRDLRTRSHGVNLADRLRAHPATRRVADRMAGTARVSSIGAKALSEHQGLLAIVAGLMFSVMGVLMGPMYTFIDDALADLSDELPDALLAVTGGGDFSTPEGWFQVETFGLMAPLAVILVAVVAGARGLAGEESSGTMSLLLANPVARRRIVAARAAAMAAYTVVVGTATFVGTALGSLLAGLDVGIAELAATSLLLTLLGLVFGGLALAISASTGRAAVATYATVGAALASHLINGFLPLGDGLAAWARLSPFYYYLGSDPLNEGMAWGHAAVLVALAAASIAYSMVGFDRRDLRRG